MTTTNIMRIKYAAALVIFILLGISFFAGYIFYQDQSINAENVHVTNITATSFTVVWTTEKKSIGEILIKPVDQSWTRAVLNKDEFEFHDPRNIDNKAKRNVHTVTIENLLPETSYNLRLGGKTWGKTLNVSSAKTAKLSDELKVPDPAYGSVVNANGDAIILVDYQGNTLSNYTADNFTYTFDLNYFTDINFTSDLNISVLNSNSDIRTTEMDLSKGYKPFPEIVLQDEPVEPDLGEIYPLLNQTAALTADAADCQNFNPCGSETCYDSSSLDHNGIVMCGTGSTQRCVVSSEVANQHPDIVGLSSGSYEVGGAGGILTKRFNCGPRKLETPLSYNSDTPAPPIEQQPVENVTQQPAAVPQENQVNFTSSDWTGTVCRIKQIGGRDYSQSGILGDSISHNPGNFPNGLQERQYTKPGGTVVWAVQENISQKIINSARKEGVIFITLGTNDVNHAVDAKQLTSDFSVRILATDPVEYQAYNGRYWHDLYYNITKPLEDNGIVPVISTIWPVSTQKFQANFGAENDTTDFYTRRTLINLSIVKFAQAHKYPMRIIHGYGQNVDFDNDKYINSGLTSISRDQVNNLLPVIPSGSYVNSSDTSEGVHMSSQEPNSQPWAGLNAYNQAITNKINNLDCNGASQTPPQISDPVNPPGVPQNPDINIPVPEDLLSGRFDSPILQQITAEQSELTINDNGVYSFYAGSDQITQREVIINGTQVTVKFFADSNANGIKDPEEEYIEDIQQFSIKKDKSLVPYDLNPGWNMVHFPLIMAEEGEVKMASDLLAEWQENKDNIIHIARYIDSKFEIVSLREDIELSANDFEILPGEGYFIFNPSGRQSIRITGQEIDSAFDVELVNGWNLIGLPQPNQFETSENMLLTLNTSGFTTDVLSRFENGLYQSLVVEDETIYGNDYNLTNIEGYFLRVEQTPADNRLELIN